MKADLKAGVDNFLDPRTLFSLAEPASISVPINSKGALADAFTDFHQAPKDKGDGKPITSREAALCRSHRPIRSKPVRRR